jgi:hypothetical protein
MFKSTGSGFHPVGDVEPNGTSDSPVSCRAQTIHAQGSKLG